MPANVPLDRVIAEAWPAATTERVDGWTRRLTAGVTRRANSVLVEGGPDDVEAAIVAVERYYESAGQPAVFLCSDALTPDHVTEELTTRGFRSSAVTWVLVTDDPLPGEPSSWEVRASPEPTEEWFAVYWSGAHEGRSAGDREIVRDVLLAPTHPTSFVSVGSGGIEVAAVGQVVVVDGTGSLQCLVTRPTHRRRGAGRAVVEGLMAEAVGLGAQRFVAAVMADNQPSLRLFEDLGLRRSHQYRYYS